MARCQYCSSDSQAGEAHTIECQVFRTLNDNPEARADMWSAFVSSIVAANEFIRLNDADNIGQREYEIMEAVIETLIREDPHSEPLFDRSTL